VGGGDAVFYLMRARLLDVAGQTDEALKVLESSMLLPGVTHAHRHHYHATAMLSPIAIADMHRLLCSLVSGETRIGKTTFATPRPHLTLHGFPSTFCSLDVSATFIHLCMP
jgi:hypothetical protein